MIMIFECDFRYAHMHIADMRRLERSFATLLQRNLVEGSKLYTSRFESSILHTVLAQH